MTRLKIKSITKEDDKVKAVINVSVSIDRGTGLDQDMTIQQDCNGQWVATIALDDFPPKDSPEEAADRLSLWLLKLSKGVKGRHIKKLGIENMFQPKHFK